MADVNVTIKLTGMEYRFLRNEMEIHADDLKEQAQEAKAPPAKTALRKREKGLRDILRAV